MNEQTNYAKMERETERERAKGKRQKTKRKAEKKTVKSTINLPNKEYWKWYSHPIQQH